MKGGGKGVATQVKHASARLWPFEKKKREREGKEGGGERKKGGKKFPSSGGL